MQRKLTAYRLCLTAMAVIINLLGGQIALLFRLPIYLDTMGTILIGALLGPVYGMLPNLISGILMGITTDIYSLYFAPVGMITGLMAGLVWKKRNKKKFGLSVFAAALIVTLPGTILSSAISAVLFGGITSSGSSILVQLLSKTVLSLPVSIILVQIWTDYVDRIISILFAEYFIKLLPVQILEKIK